MELTAYCTSEAWHVDCSTAKAVGDSETFYAERPAQMDIVFKSDKELFELRLQLRQMNCAQIQELYAHMCKSKDRRLWLIADSIHRRPAPGLQWGTLIATWLEEELEFFPPSGNVYSHYVPSCGQLYVAVYCDHIAWNGTSEAKRWFEGMYYEYCTGTTSYEWNSYTSVEIDFTTGNCCIEYDQPKEMYRACHNSYKEYW